MANKTLLNAVNEILKKVSVLAGDAGLLTSLTDSARQVSIDVAVQAVNEGIDEIYSTTGTPLTAEQAESTITLATSTRAYSLASDLVQMRWPLIDKTNGVYMFEFAGGYNRMLEIDPRQTFTGTPIFATVRPTDGKLFTQQAPTSADNGKIYTYQYDKDNGLTLLTDNVPFDNAVFRAMVPVWSQIWKREQRQSFDAEFFKLSLGRASRLLTQKQERGSWSPR